jgi:hypothetical protein
LREFNRTDEEIRGRKGVVGKELVGLKTSPRFQRILGENEGLRGGLGGEIRDLHVVVDEITRAVCGGRVRIDGL